MSKNSIELIKTGLENVKI